MLAGAHLAGVHLEDVGLDSGIVQQPERVVADVNKGLEEAVTKAHAHGYRTHHIPVHGLAAGVKIEHVGAEAIEATPRAVLAGPGVGELGVRLAANLEALLEVRGGGADLVDVGAVEQLAHLFAAGGRVAAVGLGGRPADGELGVERQVEEVGGAGKGVAQDVGGDGVVAQVDEAGRLEALENGAGGGGALVGSAVEELAKVDELCLRSVSQSWT